MSASAASNQLVPSPRQAQQLRSIVDEILGDYDEQQMGDDMQTPFHSNILNMYALESEENLGDQNNRTLSAFGEEEEEEEEEEGALPQEFCDLFAGWTPEELEARGGLARYSRIWNEACEGFRYLARAEEILGESDRISVRRFLTVAAHYVAAQLDFDGAGPQSASTGPVTVDERFTSGGNVGREPAGVTLGEPAGLNDGRAWWDQDDEVPALSVGSADDTVEDEEDRGWRYVSDDEEAVESGPQAVGGNPYHTILIKPFSMPLSWENGSDDVEVLRRYWRRQVVYWTQQLAQGGVRMTLRGIQVDGEVYLRLELSDGYLWQWSMEEPWIEGYITPGRIRWWKLESLIVGDEEIGWSCTSSPD